MEEFSPPFWTIRCRRENANAPTLLCSTAAKPAPSRFIATLKFSPYPSLYELNKMNSTKIPTLGYALLGLLHQKPASGYDLRKIFSSTSLKSYSDSPGAIYPALGRLEKQGLIRGTVEEVSGLRRRQI